MHKPLSLGPFTYSHKGEACMYSLCLVSSQPPGLVTSPPPQLPGVTPARVASQECSRGTRRSQGDHLRLLHQFHGSIACRTESRPGFSPRGQSVDGSWGRAPRKEGCWARGGLGLQNYPSGLLTQERGRGCLVGRTALLICWVMFTGELEKASLKWKAQNWFVKRGPSQQRSVHGDFMISLQEPYFRAQLSCYLASFYILDSLEEQHSEALINSAHTVDFTTVAFNRGCVGRE